MEPTPAAAAAPRRRRPPVLLFVVLLLAAAGGIGWYFATLGFESTDDAFVAADVFAINAKVPGRIARVAVRENEQVAAGQVLAELETADYDSRIAQQEAAVALAEAQLRAATIDVGLVEAQLRAATIDVGLVEASTASAVEAAAAEVTAAEARQAQAEADRTAAATEAARTGSDRERYLQLSERAVSRQRLAVVEADATAAAATADATAKRVASAVAEVLAAKARFEAARADRGRVEAARAAVEQRQAERDAARAALQGAQLDRSYTRIVAPAAGRVTKKAVLPGTYVQPGQNLMAIVGLETWVVANFKETQLAHMRPGQRATVHIDAYGIDLAAHVDSVQSGSGAAFSLLPPENATGNYVKVVQRVPVKLLFEQQPAAALVLGPGMSVVPEVDVR